MVRKKMFWMFYWDLQQGNLKLIEIDEVQIRNFALTLHRQELRLSQRLYCCAVWYVLWTFKLIVVFNILYMKLQANLVKNQLGPVNETDYAS